MAHDRMAPGGGVVTDNAASARHNSSKNNIEHTIKEKEIEPISRIEMETLRLRTAKKTKGSSLNTKSICIINV